MTTVIDRQYVRTLKKQAEKVIQEIVEDDVHVQARKAKYDRDGRFATITIEVAVESGDGTVQTKEAAAFEVNARQYGLSPDDLGAQISMQGDTYTIVGLNTRARKYPIIAKNEDDGKTYKLRAQTVQFALREDS